MRLSFVKKMIPLILALAALSSAVTPREAKAHDGEFAFNHPDSQLHIFATYGIALTTSMMYHRAGMPRGTSVLAGAATSLLIGLVKERFLDNEWSSQDMKANYIGTAFGSFVAITLQF